MRLLPLLLLLSCGQSTPHWEETEDMQVTRNSDLEEGTMSEPIDRAPGVQYCGLEFKNENLTYPTAHPRPCFNFFLGRHAAITFLYVEGKPPQRLSIIWK